ncbi:hypothetical protein [Ideonella sp. A 288]|uniref:hypothetical protein n=1 Tax=Ideonella sp. A 288 TaxID=1962181 RepID=UPI000B4A93F7|nr:hypothetical protein [Ideonella sp. A 288]
MKAPADRSMQPAEQSRYALWLDWGTRLGLAMLVLGFAAYVSGVLPPHVPVDRLPQLWSLPVGQFLAETNTPTGWGWLALLHRGDILGMAGIAVLSGCSVACLLALLPLYAARGDKAYVAICLAEVAVVMLAASGWLAGGH